MSDWISELADGIKRGIGNWFLHSPGCYPNMEFIEPFIRRHVPAEIARVQEMEAEIGHWKQAQENIHRENLELEKQLAELLELLAKCKPFIAAYAKSAYSGKMSYAETDNIYAEINAALKQKTDLEILRERGCIS